MLHVLEQQPQPVTMLFKLCQKDKRRVDIKHWWEREQNIAGVYVDGTFVASAYSSHEKENAKLLAAKVALKELCYEDTSTPLNGGNEAGAKQKLHELCGKKKWGKPIYNFWLLDLLNRFHNKNGFRRVREAENSVAYLMLCGPVCFNLKFFCHHKLIPHHGHLPVKAPPWIIKFVVIFLDLIRPRHHKRQVLLDHHDIARFSIALQGRLGST
ncbi:ribonuclease 3-like protein 2 [Striga asiatica]|uniref:Ribonuclease 3-like protein 2 n=1 Tax=Striga asiatica TaxID=4170 RepID=A0A5A7PX15_STRAF|nr:ribonuclease 3-like protein 2 [Striga asiatica]